VQTFARLVAIAAMGMLVIIGSTDALPPANAGGPECVADAAVQCADQAQAVQPDRHAGKHLTISCQPARIGAFCTKRWVP
jgi:hypothetical protein